MNTDFSQWENVHLHRLQARLLRGRPRDSPIARADFNELLHRVQRAINATHIADREYNDRDRIRGRMREGRAERLNSAHRRDHEIQTSSSRAPRRSQTTQHRMSGALTYSVSPRSDGIAESSSSHTPRRFHTRRPTGLLGANYPLPTFSGERARDDGAEQARRELQERFGNLRIGVSRR